MGAALQAERYFLLLVLSVIIAKAEHEKGEMYRGPCLRFNL